jgi:hypothetical protein
MAIEDAPDTDTDDQDLAESFDEETLGVDGDRRETFEELPDLLDVTSAVGDADDDDALIAEDLDDDEIIDAEDDQTLADPEDDALAARGDEIADEARAAQEDNDGAGPRRGDD